MSTESSATLRECPNRECKSTEIVMDQHPQILTSKAVRCLCLGCQTCGPLRNDEASARRLWNSLPREGDAKAGPIMGAYTERLARVLRESVRYVGDHRKVWIVTKDRDDVSKTWIFAAAIKCAIKELEVPRG